MPRLLNVLSRSALCLLLTAALLAPDALAQERAASLADRGITADEAAEAEALRARPDRYQHDPETGRLALTPAARTARIAPSQPSATPRRRGLEDQVQRTPQPPVYRGGALVLTVDTAFDDGLSPDSTPGDGVCVDALGACGIRTAIQEANAQPDSQPVRIEFNITEGPFPVGLDGDWRIRVNQLDSIGLLPVITQPATTIDGATQPGAACGDLFGGTPHTLRVILDGTEAPTGIEDNGIESSASFFTVRGLVVQNFLGYYGIAVSGSNALVECNYVGTDYTGTTAAPNNRGIRISGGGSVRDNLSSAHNSGTWGILVDGATSGSFFFTNVLRNLIGTDATGALPLGNDFVGIYTFGTRINLRDNLVSANGGVGIRLGGCTDVAELTGNVVGLSLAGTDAGLGNADAGIQMDCGQANKIGTSGNGNVVSANGGDGIVAGGEAVTIRSNTVGLTFSGAAAGNGGNGIATSADETGGPGASDGNIVAGNALNGIRLNGTDALVEGNTVGLNAAGEARPNGAVGTNLQNSGLSVAGSTNPVIRGNTLSGNNGSGLRFESGIPTTGAVVEDNRIGTNAAGTATRPNVESGLVLTDGVTGATVTGNTIAGNTDTGVFLSGATAGHVLENNYVGTNAAGANLGNGLPGGDGRAGVFCQSATDIRIGQNFQPNTIAYNGRDGVFLSANCQDISIVGNVIYANGELAVDLAANGPTLNDPGDGDSGANGRLNFPVITSATNDGTNATIAYAIQNGLPNTQFELLFCRANTPDPSGYGECRFPNTLQTVTTNGAGDASGTFTTGTGAYPTGSFVTANATLVSGALPDGYGPTSEFGRSVEVTGPGGAVTIAATATSPLTVPQGGTVSFQYTVTNGTNDPATGQSWYRATTSGGATVAQGVITDGTLPAGQSVTVNYDQRVAGNAVPGDYGFCLRIGLFPNAVIDEECFTVTVVPSRLAGGDERSDEGDWAALDVRESAPFVAETTVTREGTAEGAAASAASSTAGLPEAFALHAAYPNPFGRAATLRFDVPEQATVRLAVYDVLGREVAVLVDGPTAPGRHTAVLDGRALPSGTYLVRLEAGGAVHTHRLTLVR